MPPKHRDGDVVAVVRILCQSKGVRADTRADPWAMGLPRSHCGGIHRIHRRPDRWRCSPLPQDCPKRTLRLPYRVVSVSQLNDRRPLPRAFCLPDLHRNMFGTEIHAGVSMVLHVKSTGQQPTEVHCWRRCVQDVDLWWVDVYHEHGRS